MYFIWHYYVVKNGQIAIYVVTNLTIYLNINMYMRFYSIKFFFHSFYTFLCYFFIHNLDFERFIVKYCFNRPQRNTNSKGCYSSKWLNLHISCSRIVETGIGKRKLYNLIYIYNNQMHYISYYLLIDFIYCCATLINFDDSVMW